MNILADASLPGLDEAFPKPFNLTCYNHPREVLSLLAGQEVLLCRSTLKVDSTLLKNHSLRYVATASSGTDHLDKPWLAAQQIQVIDAKGSNARAVTDYVIATLAFLEQEQYIQGRNVGVIGLGQVGAQVVTRLPAADFQVIAYDPLKAMHEPTPVPSCSLDDLYQADILCIHAALHNTQPFPSLHLINSDFLSHLKPGCIIINAARGGIVVEQALLQETKPLIYCTDVYLNEPKIDRRIIDKALLCTPHIAGHSIEAKYDAVVMVSLSLHEKIGLPIPQFISPPKSQIHHLDKSQSWHEAVLAIYNPLEETSYLKQAVDKETAFLTLRKNHQKRHNFSTYPKDLITNAKTRLLLG